MRKKDALLLFAVALVVIATVLAIIISNNSKSAAETCSETGATHTVVIQNNVMTPTQTTAPRCDKLTVVNKDDITREIGFGPHDHHVPYDGVASKVLHQNESLTITLIKTGTYHFHDHFHEEVAGKFTVK